MHGSYMSLEIAIAFTGVWWLMWIVIVAPWLDARPGPPMPKGQNWIIYSWKKSTFIIYRLLHRRTFIELDRAVNL